MYNGQNFRMLHRKKNQMNALIHAAYFKKVLL